jgi:CheY-like chemotaxis protein
LFNALRGVLKPLLNANRSLDLVFEPVDDIPPLFTDESKLSQILRNFISNAIKFTERGEVRITSTLLPDGRSIRIEVRDTGIGIAPENLKLVFEEFAQVDSVVQRKVKGTGLGLPLAKKLAALLGGKIGVESEFGHGSTFYLELPLSIAGEAVAVQPSAQAETDREKFERQPLAVRRVLLVDDEEQARYVLRNVLGSGPEIIEADSALSGFDAAREHQPDVIFIDLVMQGASGFDLIRMLDANPETRTIPRIVNSSKVLNAEERNFLQENTSGILNKYNLTRDDGKKAIHSALAEALKRSRASA